MLTVTHYFYTVFIFKLLDAIGWMPLGGRH